MHIQIVDHQNDEPMYQPRISPILLPFQKKSSLCSDFFFKGSKIGLMLGWYIGSFHTFSKKDSIIIQHLATINTNITMDGDFFIRQTNVSN